MPIKGCNRVGLCLSLVVSAVFWGFLTPDQLWRGNGSPASHFPSRSGLCGHLQTSRDAESQRTKHHKQPRSNHPEPYHRGDGWDEGSGLVAWHLKGCSRSCHSLCLRISSPGDPSPSSISEQVKSNIIIHPHYLSTVNEVFGLPLARSSQPLCLFFTSISLNPARRLWGSPLLTTLLWPPHRIEHAPPRVLLCAVLRLC